MKIAMKNTSPVAIHGKAPNEVFYVPAIDGAPADIKWRKRLVEGAVTIINPAAPDSAASDGKPPAKKGK